MPDSVLVVLLRPGGATPPVSRAFAFTYQAPDQRGAASHGPAATTTTTKGGSTSSSRRGSGHDGGNDSTRDGAFTTTGGGGDRRIHVFTGGGSGGGIGNTTTTGGPSVADFVAKLEAAALPIVQSLWGGTFAPLLASDVELRWDVHLGAGLGLGAFGGSGWADVGEQHQQQQQQQQQSAGTTSTNIGGSEVCPTSLHQFVGGAELEGTLRMVALRGHRDFLAVRFRYPRPGRETMGGRYAIRGARGSGGGGGGRDFRRGAGADHGEDARGRSQHTRETSRKRAREPSPGSERSELDDRRIRDANRRNEGWDAMLGMY